MLSRGASMCTIRGVVAIEPALASHPDWLLPVAPGERAIAPRLSGAVWDVPVISPHGHVDPWLPLAEEAVEAAIDFVSGCPTAVFPL
jgi:hypothetical protein